MSKLRELGGQTYRQTDRFLTDLYWNDDWPVLLVIVFFYCPAIFSSLFGEKNCSIFGT